MTLVWHILRKDLRHTWVFAAISAILLLVFAAKSYYSFGWRPHLLRFLLPTHFLFEIALISAWALYCGVLLHAEALPGPRPYWLTRPMRWEDLLRAKCLLLLAVVAAPVSIVHIWLVVLHGFPLLQNLGAIVWNALLLGTVYMLQAAVVASITRNLQQMILWILAVSTATLALRQVYWWHSEHIQWLPNAVAVVITVTAGTAILIWQYASRRTLAGRIVVILYFCVLASVEFWPVQGWYAVQRAMSPTHVEDDLARLNVDQSLLTWHRFRTAEDRTMSSTLTIPLRIDGLPNQWSVELNGFSGLRVTAGGETVSDAVISTPAQLHGEGLERSIELAISPNFADRHARRPVDISIAAELSIYGPAEQFQMGVDETATIPGLGRCQSQAVDVLTIDCQSVFEVRSRAVGRWTIQAEEREAIIVLTQAESRSPIRLVPSLYPISFSRGGFGARSNFSNGRISISLRKPMAHVQRKIELRGIRLADIRR